MAGGKTKPEQELRGVGLGKDELRALMAAWLMECAENFLLLHGGRGPGKSYTTQKTVISDCLANDCEFVLTVPTKKLQEGGILRKWTSKVLDREFRDWQTRTTCEALYMRRREADDWVRVGTCLPLSGVEEAKNDSSIYRSRWMIWDEATKIQLDVGVQETLIELFLTAYHTIDRDEDRVKAVFMGNALNKLDPLYGFFGVTPADLKKPGLVVRSYNKAAWYVPTPPDVEDDPDNKFRRMVKGTRYGDMAAGKFDLSYGYLLGDPGEAIVTSCVGIQFTTESYLLVMVADGAVYIQSCAGEFAERYAQKIYTVLYKDATVDRPTVPAGILTTIRTALQVGRCKFVDEESLLVGSVRLKECFNIVCL